MPFTIEPLPDATSELKLGSMNLVRANGRGRDPQGNLIPQGRLFVAVTLRRFANGTDGQDLETVVTQDVEGEIVALAATDPALAAAAAAALDAADTNLKKLNAILGYIRGVCKRPTT